MSKTNYSESGSPIYHHEERKEPFRHATGDEALIGQVTKHVEEHIGAVDFVLHEIVSDLVHIDVLRVPPTKERNYYTLVTCGMSGLPMSVPEGAESFRYAELMICLPPDWDMSEEGMQREENYWPIRWLKTLARMPHEYETWLYAGHTIPNGNPAEPYASNTKLTGMLLFLPSIVKDTNAFFTLEAEPGKEIHFFSLIPLYSEEMDFKLKHGADALYDKLGQENVSELLNVNRKNVCKKSLFGFWKR